MEILEKGRKKELSGKCDVCGCEFRTNTYEAYNSSIGWFITCPDCKNNQVELNFT